MNGFVQLISLALEPNERAVVLGDLAELNESGLLAIREVAGLVIRRQANVWMDWRPWLALVGLVGMIGRILWMIASDLTSPLSRDAITYWRMGARYSSGMTTREEFILSLTLAVGMLFWSWTSGLVLGCLSRKTLWLTGTLYFLLWTFPLTLTLLAALRLPVRYSQGRPMILLLVALQTAVYLCLFVYPSIKGLRYSLRSGPPPLRRAAFLLSAVLCLTALATWNGGWPDAAVTRWAGGIWDPGRGWQLRLMLYAILAWPATFLLLTAKGHPFAKLKLDGEFRG